MDMDMLFDRVCSDGYFIKDVFWYGILSMVGYFFMDITTPSGNLLHSHWTWPFIVDLHIKPGLSS